MRSVAAGGIGVAIGIWMMFAPAVLGYTGSPATIDRIAGPVAAAAAWIAATEVTRSLRWLNVAVAIAALTSLFLVDHTIAAAVHRVLTSVGMIAAALALGRPPMKRYAGGWRALLEDPEEASGV